VYVAYRAIQNKSLAPNYVQKITYIAAFFCDVAKIHHKTYKQNATG